MVVVAADERPKGNDDAVHWRQVSSLLEVRWCVDHRWERRLIGNQDPGGNSGWRGYQESLTLEEADVGWLFQGVPVQIVARGV